MKHLGQSRLALFRELDQPRLAPLPAQAYRTRSRKIARVHIDYHVVFEKHYYSVPYTLSGKEVHVRATEKTIEIFYQRRQVAYSSPLKSQRPLLNPQRPHAPPNINSTASGHQSVSCAGRGKSGNKPPNWSALLWMPAGIQTTLPYLPGRSWPGQALLPAALGSRLYPRQRRRYLLLPGCEQHSQKQTGPTTPGTGGGPAAPPSENIRGKNYYH